MFYYGQVRDTWKENSKGCIAGSKKRKADVEELDFMKDLCSSQQPWKPIAEPEPSTNMLPTEKTNIPCLQNVKAELGASRSSSSRHLPSPSPSKGDIQMDREDHEKKMSGLIAMVHKVSGEWNRKGKEFTIAVARSSCNNLTAGSAVEAALQHANTEGEELIRKMDKVETEYVKDIHVNYTTQTEIKQDVDSVYDIIKRGNKLKLLMRDCTLVRCQLPAETMHCHTSTLQLHILRSMSAWIEVRLAVSKWPPVNPVSHVAYIYIYMYIYIFIYTYVFMYMCIYVCVCVYIYTYLTLSLYIYIYIYISADP